MSVCLLDRNKCHSMFGLQEKLIFENVKIVPISSLLARPTGNTLFHKMKEFNFPFCFNLTDFVLITKSVIKCSHDIMKANI